MIKKHFILLVQLLSAISLIGLIIGLTINTLKEIKEVKAEASPTIIRELTLNEQQRIYLYEQLNYNLKEYQLLSRVIQCESKWDANAFNSKTKDFGLMQINEYTWENKANELGYDYRNNWQDNIKMGVWIYQNSGIQNWNWSKKCWK